MPCNALYRLHFIKRWIDYYIDYVQPSRYHTMLFLQTTDVLHLYVSYASYLHFYNTYMTGHSDFLMSGHKHVLCACCDTYCTTIYMACVTRTYVNKSVVCSNVNYQHFIHATVLCYNMNCTDKKTMPAFMVVVWVCCVCVVFPERSTDQYLRGQLSREDRHHHWTNRHHLQGFRHDCLQIRGGMIRWWDG